MKALLQRMEALELENKQLKGEVAAATATSTTPQQATTVAAAPVVSVIDTRVIGNPPEGNQERSALADVE